MTSSPLPDTAPATSTQPATARLYSGKRCWLVDNDPWESPHFDNETTAIQCADRDLQEQIANDPDEPQRRAPVRQEPHPCWIRVCAQDGCDVEEIDDDFDEPMHYPQADPPTGFKCEDHSGPYPWQVFQL